MSGQYTDAALGAIRGQQDAANLLAKVRIGTASPDALAEALAAVQATGEAARVRAFLRSLGKALENQARADTA